MKKFFYTCLICVMLMMCFPLNIYAAANTASEAFAGADDFIDSADDTTDPSGNSVATVEMDENKLKEVHYFVYRTLLIISFIVTAIFGIVLGIQFMFAGVEEKADVKQRFFVFIIGVVVAYGAFGIWRALLKIIEGI